MSKEVSANSQIAAAVGSMPWWLVLIWGILAVIIGLCLIATPFTTMFYIILFMGAYWFVGGIFTLISLFGNCENKGWKIFLGIISIIGGIVIMTYPLYSSLIIITMVVIFAGIWGLIIGGTKIYEAVKFKDAGALALGVLSIIFGLILLASPYTAAYVLPIVGGIFALIIGIAAVFLSFQFKKAQA